MIDAKGATDSIVVRVEPGATALAVMPSGPSSAARLRTSPCTACLAAT